MSKKDFSEQQNLFESIANFQNQEDPFITLENNLTIIAETNQSGETFIKLSSGHNHNVKLIRKINKHSNAAWTTSSEWGYGTEGKTGWAISKEYKKSKEAIGDALDHLEFHAKEKRPETRLGTGGREYRHNINPISEMIETEEITTEEPEFVPVTKYHIVNGKEIPIHQTTLEDYQKANPNSPENEVKNLHEMAIENAIKARKAIPEAVIKDYPELANEAKILYPKTSAPKGLNFIKMTAPGRNQLKMTITDNLYNKNGKPLDITLQENQNKTWDVFMQGEDGKTRIIAENLSRTDAQKQAVELYENSIKAKKQAG